MTFDSEPVDGTALLIERMVERGFPASAIISSVGSRAEAWRIRGMVEQRRQEAQEAQRKAQAELEDRRWREAFEGARIVNAYRQVPLVPGWRQIVNEVAAKHGVSFIDIISERRPRYIVLARQEAMYRLYNETTLSFPDIGRRLGGKDHTTVLHGVTRHCERNGLPHPRRRA